MNTIKRFLTFSLLSCTILFFIPSCQEDDSSISTESQDNHLHQNKVTFINANDIPEVIDFLQSKSNDRLQFTLDHNIYSNGSTRSHTDDLSLTTPLVDQIKQATNSYGKSSYTFKLIEEETKEGVYFLNLIVKEYGDMLYMYILKYVPNVDWLENYQGDFDLGSFKGQIYVYSEMGRYVARVAMDHGHSTGSEGRTNDDCPDPDNPDGNSGGSTSGDNGSDGSTTSGTGSDSGGGPDIPIDITAEFGWRCNWRNQLHANPNDCNNPGMGGEWVILIDDANRSMANDVVCPPPNTDCDVDCDYGVGPNCECLPEETDEVENNDVPVNNEIYPYDVENPDNPINDISEFLECFDTSSFATITVYALEPNPASGDTYDGAFVGHTFVSIEQGMEVATFGFYPVSDWIVPPLNITSNGVFGDDGSGNEEYTASISAVVNGTTLQQIINFTVNFTDDYNLNDNNCTDYAIEVGNLAGMGMPDCNGNWPGGSGSNPGTLGEHIRNRANNPDFLIETTPGTGPETNKGC